MQGDINNALMLTAAGNRFLAGRYIAGFWPDAQTFTFLKACEFRVPDDSEEGALRAADPMAWFASLRPWAKGLRLHHMTRPLEANQMPGIAPRMLVAFVGGGPRWMIEAAGATTSELWQGFLRQC